MKKILLILFISFYTLTAQTELISTENPIYSYLKFQQVSGKITNYDDIVLPLSKKSIVGFLKQNDSADISENLLQKFSSDNQISKYFWEERSIIRDAFLSEKENNIIIYKDSLLNFTIDPLFSSIYINNRHDGVNNTAGLIVYGGKVKLNYGNNLAAYLEAWNGFQMGDKETAKLDYRVSRSFSFNNTKIKYFDGTAGYINYENSNLSIFAGRTTILWGANLLNPLIIGNSSQPFDFFKFNFRYKKFNYTFLHGWLVQPSEIFYIDSLIGGVKRKSAKYIAINRIGFNPSDKLKLGITQAIIYANRPLELSYLNPFLLWESAQRSSNDLDNSFLNFDIRYLISNGCEFVSSITFDDINFNLWGKGKWNTPNNRIAWQAGFNVTYPYFFNNMLINVDYIQIRPFTFSHPEIGESLTYTNNGSPLGANLSPNSIAVSVKATYFYSSNLILTLRFDKIDHGNNKYDEKGNLLYNYGGSYLVSTTLLLSDKNPKLLDGLLEHTYKSHLNIKYLFSYNLNLDFSVNYIQYKSETTSKNSLESFITLNYNMF
ncbi:MAG: capsule assembly Wzi family protein [bacterium]